MLDKLFDLKTTGNFKETLQIFWTTWIVQDYAVLPTKTPHPVIVDIGSHIDISALYFNRRHPGASIICYEPNPLTFNLLKANTSKFKNIKINNAAVSDYTGLGKFKISKVAWGDSLFDNNESSTIKVNIISAVDICHFHIDLLKMDAEGAEYAIIKSLDQSGKIANIDRLVMEYHGKINDKNKLKEILNILTKNNFNFTIGRDIRIIKYPSSVVLRDKTSKFDYLVINAWK